MPRAYGTGTAIPGRRRRTYPGAVERFRVTGGARLAGEVAVTGAKNSALKLMAVALLAPGRHDARPTSRTSSTSRSWPSCCAGSAATVTHDQAGVDR